MGGVRRLAESYRQDARPKLRRLLSGLDLVGDQAWPYTNHLLRMDGANGATDFYDYAVGAASPWTRVGTPTINTTYSKFYGSAGSFSGSQGVRTASALSADNFGASDFIVRGWVYLTTAPSAANYKFIASRDNIGVTRGWNLLVSGPASGALTATLWKNNSTNVSITAPSAFVTGLFCYVEFTRVGNTAYLFINGTLAGTVDVTGVTVQDANTYTCIGTVVSSGTASTSSTLAFSGYMNAMQIIKGVGGNTASYTPPTNPPLEW